MLDEIQNQLDGYDDENSSGEVKQASMIQNDEDHAGLDSFM